MAKETRVTYVSRRQPRVKQAEALDRINGKRVFALQMEMRTGKTKVIMDWFGRLEADGQIDDLLVIAPAGAAPPWIDEIPKEANDDLLSRLRVYLWESRKEDTKTKQRQLEAFLAHSGPRILIMNVEALSTVKRARETLLQFISQRRCMGGIDESTTIRNPTSKRTAFIVDKISPKLNYKFIATGLLTPKSPLDAFCQFEFLDKNILGHSTFASFKARYVKEERICLLPKVVLAAKLEKVTGKHFLVPGFGVVSPSDMTAKELRQQLDARKIWYQSTPKITGFQHEEELHAKTAPYSFRVRLEDCYDLPPKIYMRREVEMTDEQERVYTDLKTYFTAQLTTTEHVTASNVISMMMKLHQVLCGHTKDETGKVHDIATHRHTRLLELLAEHSGKAIIWCSYDHDVRKVSEALAKEYGESSVARFWGGNRPTREDEERLFLREQDCRYMVATAAAGGRGRTWVVADLVVYYSNTHDLEHRIQSEARAQGVDKINSVAYVDLITTGSVEEKILHCLRNKLNMASIIQGDEWRQWLI